MNNINNINISDEKRDDRSIGIIYRSDKSGHVPPGEATGITYMFLTAGLIGLIGAPMPIKLLPGIIVGVSIVILWMLHRPFVREYTIQLTDEDIIWKSEDQVRKIKLADIASIEQKVKYQVICERGRGEISRRASNVTFLLYMKNGEVEELRNLYLINFGNLFNRLTRGTPNGL